MSITVFSTFWERSNIAPFGDVTYPLQSPDISVSVVPDVHSSPYPLSQDASIVTRDALSSPTVEPATPRPITYSLSSAAEWMMYVNDEYGFTFRYPDSEPSAYEYEVSGFRLLEVVVNIRTGPTVPASSTNRAVIELIVFPNPAQQPVETFCAEYGERLGWPVNVTDLQRALRHELPSYATHLADESATALYLPEQGFFVITPPSRKYVYLVGKGYMTDSAKQDEIFRLFMENFHLR